MPVFLSVVVCEPIFKAHVVLPVEGAYLLIVHDEIPAEEVLMTNGFHKSVVQAG